VGNAIHPVTPLAFDRNLAVGSQSVISAISVSNNIRITISSISVVSIPSPELVFILKSIPSSSELVRSNTASPVEVVSDSSRYSLKNENKCSKNKIAHKSSDKDISAPSSANEGVTVETVDKSVKFRLKKIKR